MTPALQEFLLAFPALFSIVNPVSGAFIFNTVTVGLSAADHARLARRVAVNSAVVMMVALWAGSYVLAFFGITLAALRCAGGVMVALSAWSLLNAPERQEARKQEQIADRGTRDDIALFPLTIPFTTGPGTISVAIALGSARPPAGGGLLLAFFIGVSAAALATAVTVWACYSTAERLHRLLGANGGRTVTRLSAFLLLCIGVQILITGVQNVLGPLLRP
ncbi:MAG TPA: MarC family protein [Acidisphaera sp.]|nr:MarC family protein [Acidisphaera sp.]